MRDESGRDRWSPRASARTRLVVAALAWTVVGTVLGVVGLRWAFGAHTSAGALAAAIGAAAVVGWLKGRFVLARAARRNATRIVLRGDARCVFGFLSWGGWLVIPVMMAAGFLMRHSAIPRPLLGAIYLAIGVALLVGSRPMWRAFASRG